MLATLNDLTKYYGENLIFEDVNLVINEGERIGLVGQNGAGKTTLLNVLTKGELPDDGDIVYKSGLNIGYLRQNSGLSSGNTIVEEMRSCFNDVIEATQKLRTIEEMLKKDPDNKDLQRQYAAHIAVIEARDGYNIDIHIKKVLNGMGFGDTDLNMIVDSMSGGEKTRLALAKLLLESPDLLILDEPTNHLDFETLSWLEEYLNGYKGTVLTVSHDRYFLDKTSSKIWEVEDGEICEYNGNYSAYKVQKKERLEFLQKEYLKQTAKIESLEEFVRRNIARASTSALAKSRRKQLENMERIKKPRMHVKKPSLCFKANKRASNDVLIVENLYLKVGEDEKTIAENINFDIKRGEHVALIGANGAGKSTLLKSILNIEPQSGTVEWGKNTYVGYYDQENKDMKQSNSVLDEIMRRYPLMSEMEARNALGRVQIVGDEVFKKVKSLSGGERARLGLAILMSGDYNVLVLDEPTNHLDLEAREVLEQALKEYDGTILFVSHDRYFLNSISSKVMELRNGELREFVGGFDDYIAAKKLDDTEQTNIVEPKNSGKAIIRKEQRRQRAQARNRISHLERKIEELERKELEINDKLNQNATDYEEVAELCEMLEKIKNEQEQVLEEWERLENEVQV